MPVAAASASSKASATSRAQKWKNAPAGVVREITALTAAAGVETNPDAPPSLLDKLYMFPAYATSAYCPPENKGPSAEEAEYCKDVAQGFAEWALTTRRMWLAGGGLLDMWTSAVNGTKVGGD